jgi:hypothetical protein
MSFKGVVRIGEKVRVVFSADPANNGSSALMTGYVPDGMHPPPPSEFDMVAPGGVESQHTTVRAAFALRITVDVPDLGGGTLEVWINGVLKDQDQVDDTMWTYAIA